MADMEIDSAQKRRGSDAENEDANKSKSNGDDSEPMTPRRSARLKKLKEEEANGDAMTDDVKADKKKKKKGKKKAKGDAADGDEENKEGSDDEESEDEDDLLNKLPEDAPPGLIRIIKHLQASPDGCIEALADYLTEESTAADDQKNVIDVLSKVFENYEFVPFKDTVDEELRKGKGPQKIDREKLYDVVVVGAGAAGIGAGTALVHSGIEDVLIIDRDQVGSSFINWPAETRFITPSFATNSMGMLDINAVALETSPAVTNKVEHPNGKEYAKYLEVVVKHWNLPICTGVHVTKITQIKNDIKEDDDEDDRDDFEFRIHTRDNEDKPIKTKYVVWAGGEFQYPLESGVAGFEHCRHTATVNSYKDLDGDNFIIIGGYESGVDAAYHLSGAGKKVRVFDRGCPWESESTDPSVALSTWTLERMKTDQFKKGVTLSPNTGIDKVTVSDKDGKKVYTVITSDGDKFETTTQPLFAGGFEGSTTLVSEYFEKREDGFPKLDENDQSTNTPGMYLVGPAVRHDDHIFCFIYKYRQRFAVVAKAIANGLGHEGELLELYRMMNMYLDDFSGCGGDCAC